MVRSLWLRTLATSLVWTGFVCAQQSASPQTEKQSEQLVTIREAGKSPQQCKVVKSWQTSDGQLAYQVRVISTGEMMTITEKAGAFGGKAKNASMQVYHWGTRRTSPPGVPAPTSDKSSSVSSYAAKSSGTITAPSTARLPSSYATNSPPPRVPAPVSSYTTNASLASRPVSTPTPEKDWRQSWIQSEDKPLRIEDKPSMKESIADFPQLRIEGKSPVKGVALKSITVSTEAQSQVKGTAEKLPEKHSETLAKAAVPTSSKSEKRSDDLLQLPPSKEITVLDITPRSKAGATGSKETTTTIVQKTPLPEVPSVQLPVVTDLTGTLPDSKIIKPTQKPDTTPLTLPEPQVLAAKPMVPALSGNSLANSGGSTSKPYDLPKLAGSPKASPLIPEIAQLPRFSASTTPPELAGSPKASPLIPEMAQSQQSSASTTPPSPVVPALESAKDATSTTVAATPIIPQLSALVPLPAAPIPAVESGMPAVAPKLAPPPQAERPNFLVMDASKANGKDQSIKLPGVPSTVVTFGQPVTVTAPPPDTVRKKSLEAHSVKVMLDQLRDSVFPSQREWAAEALCSANWKVHPEISEALCKAAIEDPAPTVRVRCIHTLSRMDVRSTRTLDTMHKLQVDKDETVRAQADEVVKSLAPVQAPHE